VQYRTYSIFLIVVGVAIVVGLWLGFERTRMGAQIRAAVDNRRMAESLGINIDRLFTITNMPIARFADWLRRADLFDQYLDRLRAAFNPSTVPGLMCRNLISVSYDGRLYDCDFNQMLELGLAPGVPGIRRR